MKRVLITGAAGFIGSHLAERLLARGDQVVAIDNFNTYYDPEIKRANVAQALEHPEYYLYEMDICDGAKVFELFEQAKQLNDYVVELVQLIEGKGKAATQESRDIKRLPEKEEYVSDLPVPYEGTGEE